MFKIILLHIMWPAIKWCGKYYICTCNYKICLYLHTFNSEPII